MAECKFWPKWKFMKPLLGNINHMYTNPYLAFITGTEVTICKERSRKMSTKITSSNLLIFENWSPIIFRVSESLKITGSRPSSLWFYYFFRAVIFLLCISKYSLKTFLQRYVLALPFVLPSPVTYYSITVLVVVKDVWEVLWALVQLYLQEEAVYTDAPNKRWFSWSNDVLQLRACWSLGDATNLVETSCYLFGRNTCHNCNKKNNTLFLKLW